MHCLNLSAVQLSTLNRIKLVNIIKRLSVLDNATKYNGRVLYNIFKRYAPDAVRQCYRTYWRQYISRYALTNYGLNKKEDFDELEKNYQDKSLFESAKRDLIVSMLNMYTRKGVMANISVKPLFAQPIHSQPIGTIPGNVITPTETPVGNQPNSPPIETPPVEVEDDDMGF